MSSFCCLSISLCKTIIIMIDDLMMFAATRRRNSVWRGLPFEQFEKGACPCGGAGRAVVLVPGSA